MFKKAILLFGILFLAVSHFDKAVGEATKLEAGPSETGQVSSPQSLATVKLFYRGGDITIGEPLELVLEIHNDSQETIPIFNIVAAGRRFIGPPALVAKQDQLPLTPNDSKDYAVIDLELSTPLSKSTPFLVPIGPENLINQSHVLLKIEPGKSLLTRFDWPARCLATGDCTLRLSLSRGGQEIAHGETLHFTCKEPPK